MLFGSIDVFIGFTINADPIYFYNPDFPGPICSAFSDEEIAEQLDSALLGSKFSEEKIGYPLAVFNGEANPDLEPEQIFPPRMDLITWMTTLSSCIPPRTTKKSKASCSLQAGHVLC
jgi:hypothetical protein